METVDTSKITVDGLKDNEDAVQVFNENGFLIIRSAFSTQALEGIKKRVFEKIEDETSALPWRVRYAKGNPSVRELSNVYKLLPEAKELFLKNETLALVERIIGQNLYLYRDAIVEKFPNPAGMFPLHQDSVFWDILPQDLISLWIPLQDTNEHNGVLEVVAGSHKSQLPHVIKIGKNTALPDFANRMLKSFANRITGEKNSERKTGVRGALTIAVGNFLNKRMFPFLSRNFKFFEKFAELFVVKNDNAYWAKTFCPDLKLGDCVLYHGKTIHGSRGNTMKTTRMAYIPSFMGANYTRKGQKISDPEMGYSQVTV